MALFYKIGQYWEKIPSIRCPVYMFIIGFSLFNIGIYNIHAMSTVYRISSSIYTTATFFGVLFFCYIAGSTLLFRRHIIKIVATLILFINAGVVYFIHTYSVQVDSSMLRNVLETNASETLELLNPQFFAYLFFFACLPTVFILKIRIEFGSYLKEALSTVGIILFSFIFAIILIIADYKDLSSMYRRNKHIRYTITPLNYIGATVSLVQEALGSINDRFVDITGDTKIHLQTDKPNIFIFILGEAARAKNFATLGGTKNPLLEKENIFYYPQFYSCGTSTAVSVPCMFSAWDRKNFSVSKKNTQSNLLDFLKKANFYVYWRDNNSDSKGVANRVDNDIVIREKNPQYCTENECFDEILLEDLPKRIESTTAENTFLVLHQKGSHGPAYYLRTPKNIKRFTPECTSELFSACTEEEIINAYDNTIAYTSYIIDSTITILEKYKNTHNVALIYVSDHGQSLGENNIYLHGTPYIIAPIEQRHIPFLLWLPEDTAQQWNINRQCLVDNINKEYSHDSIFHSILGLFSISTSQYNPDLDIFSTCKTQ